MTISRPALILSAVTLAALAAVAAMPQLLRDRVANALDAISGASPTWLWVGGAGFALAFACTVAAWRAAFAAVGGRICPLQAGARLGVGCMVNSFAPAKLGDAVKVALCARAIDAPGRMWTAGGVYAWNSKADAEAMYTDAWRAFVRVKYGTEPTVTYFDCPVVVDNVAQKVIADELEA